MRSTAQLRALHGPVCGGGMVTIAFGTAGARVTVRPYTVGVWRAVEAIMVRYGYLIRQVDTGAYNCRRITGGTGYSLHAYLIAVDVNWTTNPYGSRLVTDMPPAMIAEIKALRTRGGHPVLRWGGDYSSVKDAMHFEVVASPAELALGLTVQPAPSEEDDVITPTSPPALIRQLQHLVNRLVYETGGQLDGGGHPHDRGGSHINADGKFGPTTFEFVQHAIWRAERWVLGHPIYADAGAVSAQTQAWLVVACDRAARERAA